jgi:hypothetical protein
MMWLYSRYLHDGYDPVGMMYSTSVKFHLSMVGHVVYKSLRW